MLEFYSKSFLLGHNDTTYIISCDCPLIYGLNIDVSYTYTGDPNMVPYQYEREQNVFST